MAPFLNITFDRPFFLFIYDALNKVCTKDDINPPLKLLSAKGLLQILYNIEQSLGPSLKITSWDDTDKILSISQLISSPCRLSYFGAELSNLSGFLTSSPPPPVHLQPLLSTCSSLATSVFDKLISFTKWLLLFSATLCLCWLAASVCDQPYTGLLCWFDSFLLSLFMPTRIATISHLLFLNMHFR